MMKLKEHDYKLISYDVWGNDEDGYEVNDARFTGDEITFKQDISHDNIINKLKERGWIDKACNNDDIEILGEDGYSLYFTHTVDYYPMFELRCEDNI